MRQQPEQVRRGNRPGEQAPRRRERWARRPARRALLAGTTALAMLAAGSIAAVTTPPAHAATVTDGDYASLVNPFVGTEDEGNAFPGAVVPFGMVQLSPDNSNTYASTSYDHTSGKVWGFSHRHINSAGCPAAGEVLVTPSTSATPITEREYIDLQNREETEKAEAGYYTAQLANGVTAELTATERTGVHRYTFPEGEPGHISVNVGQTLNTTGASQVHWVDDHTLEGQLTTSGFCWGTPEITYYFSATFDRPAQTVGTWGNDGTYAEGSTDSVVEDGLNGAVATFDTSSDQTVEMTVGVSFVDLQGARKNRKAEGYDDGTRVTFDQARQQATQVWNDALGRYQVTMDDPEQLGIFYTQLYKSLLSPRIGSDVDGRYRGMDLQVHQTDGWTYYQTFSLWDTYRTQATMHALFERDRAQDIVRSMYRARVEGGWLPRWSLGPAEAGVMAGDPVSPWLAVNFSLGTVPEGISDELWGYLVENATTAPPEDVRSPGRQSAEYYLEHGHVPFYPEGGGGLGDEYEEYRHGGSATMEFALADAAIGAAAHRTGRDEVAGEFLQRGTNWSTLWNPDVELSGGFEGIVNAVTADGEFVTAPEIAPVQQTGFHEGLPWHYQWMAPQDVTGLIDAMGGKKAFADRLDFYFNIDALRANPGQSPDSWAAGGSDYYSSIGYNPGNEPMLGNPWLYGYIGQPAKTSDVLAAQLNRFPSTPGGGVGNDDLGTMSSWYVLASLGIYPVMPGSGIMAINAPQVQHAEIALDNGKTIEISAPEASTDAPRYIESMSIDGAEHSAAWVDVSQLLDGARIQYSLTDSPEGLTWATGPGEVIPSVSDPLQADLSVQAAEAPEATAGEAYRTEIAVAELEVTSGRLTEGGVPIEASIEWDDGSTTPLTIAPRRQTRAGDDAAARSFGLELERTFVDAGPHVGDLVVRPAMNTPAFAPEPFAPGSTTISVRVHPGQASGGNGAGGAHAPDEPATPSEPGPPQEQASTASQADADSAAGADAQGGPGAPGALPTTGAPIGLLVAGLLALLATGGLLLRRARLEQQGTSR